MAAMGHRGGNPRAARLTRPLVPGIIRAVHSLSRRLTAVLALALWTAAGFAPFAVALHVALHSDGHGEHLHTRHLGTQHVHEGHVHPALDLSELLQAAWHGHPHDTQAVPDHEHTAVARGSVPHPEPSSTALPTLAALDSGAPFGDPSDLERMPHRGPPTPLFTTHCSLLL